jgi:hypothetical protein
VTVPEKCNASVYNRRINLSAGFRPFQPSHMLPAAADQVSQEVKYLVEGFKDTCTQCGCHVLGTSRWHLCSPRMQRWRFVALDRIAVPGGSSCNSEQGRGISSQVSDVNQYIVQARPLDVSRLVPLVPTSSWRARSRASRWLVDSRGPGI